MVGSVVREKQVSVSMKDQGLESVKDGEFPEGLFFEKAGTLVMCVLLLRRWRLRHLQWAHIGCALPPDVITVSFP